ncbi:MAG: dihydrolipoamide acetyltransferase family protein [Armatimonadota bacterium]|nr:dihydrolipoamide acetyltransferase family protein [Armatimonadota bacterium]MDR7459465.1 dihydrolipoamide acetyltransferase family protein [Armatimonadota bacterium]MDR7480170.1 dihydrolipoamide acetyltransferase family protein [Armatimonadota bacterium]MDR7502784.1 dihydrolipoamide acetyltransferase family protein [Armatimonadota bacterium]MDR7526736.1 dihydrolipoamide acetyltransferase family protein [Armatimonadota bacterium]
MATPVILPKFDMTMAEGTLGRWLVGEGQAVRRGDPLVEVITDKVTMEVEAPADGVLAGVRARERERVPVAAVIAYIVAPGEAPPAPAAAAAPGTRPAGEPPAAPAVRRRAREAGVDLATLRGTGPGGRITEHDLEAALAARRSPPDRLPATPGGGPAVEPHLRPPGERRPLDARRRTIAARMAQSAREIPHIYLRRAVDFSGLAPTRVYTAAVVAAAARALRAHPLLRAAFQEDAILVHQAIDVAVAVDTPQGVVAPVVRAADGKSVQAIQAEVALLAERARAGTLRAEDLQGAAFTVSNLGVFGVDAFTVLIPPGQSALLALGAVRPRPWAVGNAVAVRPVGEVVLALDHRVADGADGARFLDDLCRLLAQGGGTDQGPGVDRGPSTRSGP